jgi:hypothetical protein
MLLGWWDSPGAIGGATEGHGNDGLMTAGSAATTLPKVFESCRISRKRVRRPIPTFAHTDVLARLAPDTRQAAGIGRRRNAASYGRRSPPIDYALSIRLTHSQPCRNLAKRVRNKP